MLITLELILVCLLCYLVRKLDLHTDPLDFSKTVVEIFLIMITAAVILLAV